MTAALGQLELRRVFAAYPTGVAAISALVDGEPRGIAASSFVPVSLSPPLVSVCVARTSTTWPVLRTAQRLGISVLAAHQEQAGRQLGARDGERFAALPWNATAAGAVRICGASAWLDCSLEREIPAGDHDIVLLRVQDMALGAAEVSPLIFHGSTYRRLQPGHLDGRPGPAGGPAGESAPLRAG
jgi:flavin reductase (DIM6/NTAB) family NADH-FMN oxidoreductase RutF